MHLGQPEGFGIVMLEAFAAGCRLVVLPDTFLDDLPEPLREQGIERARSLAIDDVAAALAASLRSGCPRPGLWASRQTLAPQFSVEQMSDTLAAACRKLAGR